MATKGVAWEYAVQWVQDEYFYATDKITQDPESDDQKTLNNPDYWEDQIAMYVHRAYTLGLDTPGGRQAAGKAAATAMCFLESVVRVCGPLPIPGVPSGQGTDALRPIVVSE